jgi:hypothetical protein
MVPSEVENLLLESRMPSYRSPESRSKPNIVTTLVTIRMKIRVGPPTT